MNSVSQTSGRSSPNSKRTPGRGMSALLLICGLAISGCASKSPLVVRPDPVRPDPVRLSPPPAELMEPEQPNLRQRLRQLSGESPQTATGPSGN